MHDPSPLRRNRRSARRHAGLSNPLFYLAVVLSASSSSSSAAAASGDHALFATSDQNPFIQIYSLPSPATGPVPPAGGWAWQLSFDLASNSITEETPNGERIVLDGETYRTGITFSYGLSERLTAAINVPLIAHSGGFLDGFVSDWHSLFGLSNARRNSFEKHQLEYAYVGMGDERHALQDRGQGLGDVRLSADWRLRGAEPGGRSLVLRPGLKLPTGSSSVLRGSGGTDLSLQLLSDDQQTLAAWKMTLSWMLGGLWLGEGEVLDGLRRDLVAIGSIGVSRRVWQKLSARVQLDGHTSFYDSTLQPLGSSGLQITFGGSIDLAGAGRVDLAMVENLVTDTIPDFGIHLAWRGKF